MGLYQSITLKEEFRGEFSIIEERINGLFGLAYCLHHVSRFHDEVIQQLLMAAEERGEYF